MRAKWWGGVLVSSAATAFALGCLGEDVAPGDPSITGDAGGSDGSPGGDGGTSESDAGAADAALSTFTLDPARPRIARGAKGSAKLTVTRLGTPTEIPVSLTGLPAGVTATTPTIGASTDSTTIGFDVKEDAGVGFFPFSVGAASASSLAATLVVPGAPSGFDTSFDQDGILLEAGTGNYNAVLVLPDGGVVAAGASAVGGGTWVVRRYGADGVADATWNAKTVGKLPTTNAPRAIARDAASGKLYVVGSSTGNAELLTIVRLNPDGSVDESWAGGGTYRATTVETPQGSRGNAAVVLPDGKLVVAGQRSPVGLVARYTTDGQADGTFAQFTTSGNGELFGIALLPSSGSLGGGRVLATGTDSSGSPPAQLAARLTVDGSPDTVFGPGGVRTYASGCRGVGFAMTSDGDAVLVGNDVTAPALCTTRIAASAGGNLGWTQKTSAGSSGSFTTAAPVWNGTGSYSGGEAGGSQDRFALLERRLANGDPDATFGEGGTLRIEDPAVPDVYRYVIRASATATDGRLVLVGSRSSGGTTTGFVMRIWQ